MFDIEYKGANTVIISTKGAKIVADPKLSLVGMKDIQVKDAVEIATEERYIINNDEAKLIIDSPGEFGVADVNIKGIATQRHLDAESEGNNSTIYRISIGDSRIGLIGNIYEKLSDEQLEELGVIDVLIIPVGGAGYTLDATGAANLVRKINPKVVIPVHYADKDLRYEVPQDSLEAFVKEMGVKPETVQKYKVKPPITSAGSIALIELSRT